MSESPITRGNTGCDLYIDRPVYIMKLDAAVNMYHHFCDFFNLFASLFIKRAVDGTDQFSTDVQVQWSTGGGVKGVVQVGYMVCTVYSGVLVGF